MQVSRSTFNQRKLKPSVKRSQEKKKKVKSLCIESLKGSVPQSESAHGSSVQ